MEDFFSLGDLHSEEVDDSFLKDTDLSITAVENALQVMRVCIAKPEFFQHPKMKEFRELGQEIFMKQQMKRMFDGAASEADYHKKKWAKKEQKKRDLAKRLADRKHVNAVQQRRERIDALNALLLETPEVPLLTEAEANLPVEEVAEEIELNPNGELNNARSCYICKARFLRLHHFYDNQCPDCADRSWTKRNKRLDLTGRVAIVTGGRIKIGYYAALRLLECGAEVVVTTRFPQDAAVRFHKAPTYAQWKDRLHCFGLDFRDLRSVEQFCTLMYEKFSRLDILLNNAAQSVRKPPSFYSHLLTTETTPAVDLQVPELLALNESVRHAGPVAALAEGPDSAQSMTLSAADFSSVSSRSVLLSQVPVLPGDEVRDSQAFPEGRQDVHGQQLDLRETNSWLMRAHEVPTAELLEVFAINSIAPFILNARLKGLLLKSPESDRFVVNVSAMEGKFYRHKTPHHPHTNMAKASLNMLTRTSAQDYAQDRIWMNSVDTGWVTDENPLWKADAHSQLTNFMAPLDEMEGASRVLDPVFCTLENGQPIWGKFLKDFQETEW